MSGLRRALIGLAVAGLAFGLMALALVATSDHQTESAPFIVLALTLGWGFIGAGLYAWWRRPEHRIGPLMTFVGFTWFLGALSESDAALVYTLGAALSSVWVGAFVQTLVAFPSGRVGPGLDRVLVRLGWSVPVLQASFVLVTARPDESCRDCPGNLLLVWDSKTASSASSRSPFS